MRQRASGVPFRALLIWPHSRTLERWGAGRHHDTAVARPGRPRCCSASVQTGTICWPRDRWGDMSTFGRPLLARGFIRGKRSGFWNRLVPNEGARILGNYIQIHQSELEALRSIADDPNSLTVAAEYLTRAQERLEADDIEGSWSYLYR